MVTDVTRQQVAAVAAGIAALPYRWPCPPGARSARETKAGSCASKHALLAEELVEIGVRSRPIFMIGALVPQLMADDPEIRPGIGLVEVHECLTVSVPEVGPCLVDISWDPPLIEAGLPGTIDWDGSSDMVLAFEAQRMWAPDPERLREEKEALRSRLYRGEDRAVRDDVLAAMSRRFEDWRG